MAKNYSCSLEVRGYELDSFGHVNHAVYISYLEHARWKLLEEEGITLEKFNAWKCWPVISKLEIKYLKPTFMADLLDIRTRILDYGRTNFTFEHVIFRKDVPVVEAQVQTVMVNETGKPTSLPPEVQKLWLVKDEGSAI